VLQRKCPIALVAILECWFSKVYACVKLGNCFSSGVQLNSGTLQGGLLSPTLFAVFINDVLVKLNKSGLGYFIHSLCFNAFMYADDIILLTISVEDRPMQKMQNICNVELKSSDIFVNTNKSVCMRVEKRYLATVNNL